MSSASSTSSASSASIPLPKSAQELEQVFCTFLNGDSTTIKQAETILKAFVKKTDCVGALMQQLVSSTQPVVRQAAGVLLRGCLNTHWRRLTSSIQDQIKKALLQRLVKEPYRLARLAVAALISSLSKHLVPAKKWNELLETLTQLAKSTDIVSRELAMLLFRALTDTIGKVMKNYLTVLLPLFKSALEDKTDSIKIEAIKAITLSVDLLETKDQLEAFQNTIPTLAATISAFIKEGKEDPAALAFELFESIADSAAPLLDLHLTDIMKLMISISTATKLDIGIRESANNFVTTMIANKPRKLLNAKLLPTLLSTAFQLLMSDYPDSIHPEEVTPQKLGAEILYSLFETMPNRQAICQMCLTNLISLLTSKVALERKSAFIAMACLFEHYADQLGQHLDKLMDCICSGLLDTSYMVRMAACVALTQMADNCEDLNKYYKTVIPRLLTPLQNPSEHVMVKRKACLALEFYLQSLEVDEIKDYLEAIMKCLLQTVVLKELTLQEAALAAMKSVAYSAEANFAPYFQNVIKLVVPIIESKSEDYVPLRIKAIECVGAFALAVGKKTFASYVDGFMKLISKAMDTGFFEMREAGYHFFGNLSETLEGDVAPYAQAILTFIFSTLKSDDGVLFSSPNDDIESKSPLAQIEAQADAEDAEEEEKSLLDGTRKVNIAIHTGALDEKAAALVCLKSLIEQLGKGFLAYVEKTFKYVDEVCEYGHPSIRVHSLYTFHALIGLMRDCFPNAQKWKAGVAVPLHDTAKAFLAKVLPDVYARLVSDESKEVVGLACEVITDTCQWFGLGAIQKDVENIMKTMHTLLAEKAPCQIKQGDDESTDNEEKNFDTDLLDSITDLVAMLAQLIGPKFEDAFKNYLPLLLKFSSSKRLPQDRSCALGCIAEVAHELGSLIVPYYKDCFPAAIEGLTESQPVLRRNAAFCVGNLCESGGTAAVAYYEKVLPLLAKCFDQKEYKEKESKDFKFDFLGARDNAVSALCKMISNSPTSLPLEKIVPMIIQSCPIQTDYQEVKYVYSCLLTLFRNNFSLMSPHSAAMLKICSSAAEDECVPEEVRKTMATFGQALAKQVSTSSSSSSPSRS
eukprot:TRINITY_DN2564_c0_g1_i1.p1 TRINITY_DN2564_c0_g1~~TRINITY_DN2564_c0_g1_i1.p1  ORF type:complete len:1088 (+),score=286.20 TRINITY_DN2564_c0_g1_i1:111-3374(+)